MDLFCAFQPKRVMVPSLPLRFGEPHRDHWRRDYAYDCRVVRERIVTPSGRVVYETHRTCD